MIFRSIRSGKEVQCIIVSGARISGMSDARWLKELREERNYPLFTVSRNSGKAYGGGSCSKGIRAYISKREAEYESS